MKPKAVVYKVLKYVLLTLAALCFVVPIWMMFVSAFRQTTNILSYPPKFWPNDGNWDNFTEIFTMQKGVFLRWFWNSVVVSGLNTILVVVISALAGYAFAKRSFPGKNALLVTIIATQMIPAVATLIPQYLLVSRMGLVNTYSGLLLPSVANAFGVFLMTQFMREIPDAVLEAAEIDGANAYGTFNRIVFPMVMPTVSLLAIFNFTQQWGSLTWPLIIVTQGTMRTLPLGIASMKDLSGSVSGPIMAGSLVSFVPVLIAFLCAREKFIAGMTLGAVKG